MTTTRFPVRWSDASAGAAGQPGLVDVRAGGMRLQGLDPGNVRVGDHVLAFIRPENIEVIINGDSAEEPNFVRGRIDQIVFEGPTVRLIVDVEGVPDQGDGRRARAPDASGSGAARCGAQVARGNGRARRTGDRSLKCTAASLPLQQPSARQTSSARRTSVDRVLG